jgi:uncharacterized membrane protein YeiB
MPERASTLRPTLDQRIESIDAGRGIAILLMLFVNDIAGVNGIPAWMKHTPRGMDGLTFAEIGADHDWRWTEQWLPHAAWYLLAASIKE